MSVEVPAPPRQADLKPLDTARVVDLREGRAVSLPNHPEVVLGLTIHDKLVVEKTPEFDKDSNIVLELCTILRRPDGHWLCPNPSLPCLLDDADVYCDVLLSQGSTVKVGDRYMRYNYILCPRRRTLPPTPGTVHRSQPPPKPKRTFHNDTESQEEGDSLGQTEEVSHNGMEEGEGLGAEWCMISVTTLDEELLQLMSNPDELANLAASNICRQITMHTDLLLPSAEIDYLFRVLQEVSSYCHAALVEFVTQYNAEVRLSLMSPGGDTSQTAQPAHRPVIHLLTELLRMSLDPVDHVILWLKLLATLSRFTQNMCVLVACKTTAVVQGAMAAYLSSSQVQQYGCALLAQVAMYKPHVNEKGPLRESGVELLVCAMTTHSDEILVLRSASRALANLTYTYSSITAELISAGQASPEVEECVKRAVSILDLVEQKGFACILNIMHRFAGDLGIQAEGCRLLAFFTEKDGTALDGYSTYDAVEGGQTALPQRRSSASSYASSTDDLDVLEPFKHDKECWSNKSEENSDGDDLYEEVRILQPFQNKTEGATEKQEEFEGSIGNEEVEKEAVKVKAEVEDLYESLGDIQSDGHLDQVQPEITTNKQNDKELSQGEENQNVIEGLYVSKETILLNKKVQKSEDETEVLYVTKDTMGLNKENNESEAIMDVKENECKVENANSVPKEEPAAAAEDIPKFESEVEKKGSYPTMSAVEYSLERVVSDIVEQPVQKESRTRKWLGKLMRHKGSYTLEHSIDLPTKPSYSKGEVVSNTTSESHKTKDKTNRNSLEKNLKAGQELEVVQEGQGWLRRKLGKLGRKRSVPDSTSGKIDKTCSFENDSQGKQEAEKARKDNEKGSQEDIYETHYSECKPAGTGEDDDDLYAEVDINEESSKTEDIKEEDYDYVTSSALKVSTSEQEQDYTYAYCEIPNRGKHETNDSIAWEENDLYDSSQKKETKEDNQYLSDESESQSELYESVSEPAKERFVCVEESNHDLYADVTTPEEGDNQLITEEEREEEEVLEEEVEEELKGSWRDERNAPDIQSLLSGQSQGLTDSIDWATMVSSCHWADGESVGALDWEAERDIRINRTKFKSVVAELKHQFAFDNIENEESHQKEEKEENEVEDRLYSNANKVEFTVKIMDKNENYSEKEEVSDVVSSSETLKDNMPSESVAHSEETTENAVSGQEHTYVNVNLTERHVEPVPNEVYSSTARIQLSPTLKSASDESPQLPSVSEDVSDDDEYITPDEDGAATGFEINKDEACREEPAEESNGIPVEPLKEDQQIKCEYEDVVVAEEPKSMDEDQKVSHGEENDKVETEKSDDAVCLDEVKDTNSLPSPDQLDLNCDVPLELEDLMSDTHQNFCIKMNFRATITDLVLSAWASDNNEAIILLQEPIRKLLLQADKNEGVELYPADQTLISGDPSLAMNILQTLCKIHSSRDVGLKLLQLTTCFLTPFHHPTHIEAATQCLFSLIQGPLAQSIREGWGFFTFRSLHKTTSSLLSGRTMLQDENSRSAISSLHSLLEDLIFQNS